MQAVRQTNKLSGRQSDMREMMRIMTLQTRLILVKETGLGCVVCIVIIYYRPRSLKPEVASYLPLSLWRCPVYSHYVIYTVNDCVNWL